MSVINTMLQDLDKRNGRPGGEAVAGEAVRSVKPESRWHLGRNTLLLVGLSLVFLAAGFWLRMRNAAAGSPAVVIPAPPVPVIANNAAPVAVPVAVPAPSAATAMGASTTAPPVATTAPPAAAPPIAEPKARPMAAAPTPARVAAAAPTAVPAKAAVSTGTAPAAATAAVAPAKAAAATAQPAASSPLPAALAATPTPPRQSAAAQGPTSAAANAAAGKTYSPRQLSANLIAEATLLDRQGRQDEAKLPLQKALAADPQDVAARQMLAQLHMDTGRTEQARAVLAEGLRLQPDQPGFSLPLARLMVDGGDLNGAIRLLEAEASRSRDEPQVHAFLGALLLRAERYDDAVKHYLVALRTDPGNPSWLVGAGVALEGIGKPVDAAEAYRRAGTAPNLSAETSSFLNERLARLGQ
jgi:MSHA biogenesis protein MshN